MDLIIPDMDLIIPHMDLIIPDMDAEFLFLFFMISSYICLEAHDVVPL